MLWWLICCDSPYDIHYSILLIFCHCSILLTFQSLPLAADISVILNTADIAVITLHHRCFFVSTLYHWCFSHYSILLTFRSLLYATDAFVIAWCCRRFSHNSMLLAFRPSPWTVDILSLLSTSDGFILNLHCGLLVITPSSLYTADILAVTLRCSHFSDHPTQLTF